MAVKICEHIKASGIRCGSPAPKGERLCYFHKSLGQALPIRSVLFDPCLDQRPDPTGNRILMMPLLEDAASIQMAYMQVLGAILYNEMDPRKGRGPAVGHTWGGAQSEGHEARVDGGAKAPRQTVARPLGPAHQGQS